MHLRVLDHEQPPGRRPHARDQHREQVGDAVTDVLRTVEIRLCAGSEPQGQRARVGYAIELEDHPREEMVKPRLDLAAHGGGRVADANRAVDRVVAEPPQGAGRALALRADDLVPRLGAQAIGLARPQTLRADVVQRPEGVSQPVRARGIERARQQPSPRLGGAHLDGLAPLAPGHRVERDRDRVALLRLWVAELPPHRERVSREAQREGASAVDLVDHVRRGAELHRGPVEL